MFFKHGEQLYRMEERDIITYLKNEILIELEKYHYEYLDEPNDDVKNLRNEIFVKEQGFLDEFDEYDENKISTYAVPRGLLEPPFVMIKVTMPRRR